MDWVYIDNLVQSYICIIKKHNDTYLKLNNNNNIIYTFQNYPNIYFISDGTPIESFEFLKPLAAGN